MTKKFTLIAAILLAVLNVCGEEENSLPGQLAAKLQEFRKTAQLEEVYLQTDKEVYAPGAVVWFSAFITDRTRNQLSARNSEMTVNFYDASGNVIAGDKFLTQEGVCKGDLQLPENLPLGRYYLTAYTPEQINPGQVFVKPLIIDQFYQSDARVEFITPRQLFSSGKDALIEMNITDHYGKPVDRFQLTYEVRHGEKKLSEGKLRSARGNASVSMELPASTGASPVELIVSHPKGIWSEKLTLMTTTDELTLNFYPEGGTLTGTIPQKTGYFVTTHEGVPVEIDGDIVNGSGEVISKTKTFMPGYGLFPFQGKEGERYKLVVTSEYGKGQSFDLPSVDGKGVTLVVQKSDQESVTADLVTSPSESPRKLVVAATRGADLLWAADLEITAASRIRIPADELGGGLVLLSVFDEALKPLSNRLVFLPEKKSLSLEVTGEPTGDGNVKVTVKSSDENQQPVNARIFLSIADKLRTFPTDQNITSWMALAGQLKNPGGNAIQPEAIARPGVGLDFVLIANGLAGCPWEQALRIDGDREQDIMAVRGIRGQIVDKKGAVVPRAKVSVMSMRDMQVQLTDADDEGRFFFSDFQPVNVSDFNITATDAQGKGNFQVRLGQTFAEMVGMKVKALDYGWQLKGWAPEVIRDYLTANPDLIVAQPVIRSTRVVEAAKKNENYKKLLQTSTSLMEVIKSIRPYTLMNGQIVFPGTINSINFQSGALIVIDGQKMGTQADVLNSISPYDVDEINISLDPIDIQKYTGMNNVGLIEITTKRGEMVTSPEMPSGQEVSYISGYRIPRVFLSNESLENQSGKDLRTTLFLDQEMRTGPSGTRVFSVPLSAVKSGFVIRAEGFSSGMETASGRAEFEVK